MAYSVIFDTKAAKELANLPADIKTRIYRKIVESKEDPLRFFERLEGRKDYKLRVGDYRVIADINENPPRHSVRSTRDGLPSSPTVRPMSHQSIHTVLPSHSRHCQFQFPLEFG